MKRWLFIVGIIIILALIAVWLFLLFADNETRQDIYNRFGFEGAEEEGVINTIVDAILPDLEPEPVSLRQLTTKRIIGYAEVVTASSSPQMYFGEAGTGHIYSINFQNGVEAKISNITVAGARMAHIAKTGTFAAIKATEEETGPLTVVLFKNGGTESFTINEAVLDFTITDSDQLLYSVAGADGVIGRTYDIEGRVGKTIFSIPFHQALVSWGSRSEGPHYVLPKTARTLDGYLYKIDKNGFKRTSVSGYGLAVLPTGVFTLFTKAESDKYRLFLNHTESDTTFPLETFFFPEKCTFSSSSVVYCGTDARSSDGLFPDNWYRGEVSYADEIWSLNLETLEKELLINTLAVSGREIDIVEPSLSHDEFKLYFKNKNDNTLWVYDVIEN